LKRHWPALLALLFAATIWGATFVLIKHVLASIAVERFIFWRFLVGGAILLSAAWLARELPRHVFLPGSLLGVLVFGGYWLQTRGLLEISPSRSAFLTALCVVMVPLLERLVWGAPVPPLAIGSTLIATGGTFLLVGGISGRFTRGDILTVLCALLFAIHIVLSARLSRKVPVVGLAAVQVAVVALIAAPFSGATGAAPLSREVIVIILLTGCVTTALCFYLMMWSQSKISATEAAVILAFEPVAAALTSLVFGERLTMHAVAGGTLIVAAMILSQVQRPAQDTTLRRTTL